MKLLVSFFAALAAATVGADSVDQLDTGASPNLDTYMYGRGLQDTCTSIEKFTGTKVPTIDGKVEDGEWPGTNVIVMRKASKATKEPLSEVEIVTDCEYWYVKVELTTNCENKDNKKACPKYIVDWSDTSENFVKLDGKKMTFETHKKIGGGDGGPKGWEAKFKAPGGFDKMKVHVNVQQEGESQTSATVGKALEICMEGCADAADDDGDSEESAEVAEAEAKAAEGEDEETDAAVDDETIVFDNDVIKFTRPGSPGIGKWTIENVCQENIQNVAVYDKRRGKFKKQNKLSKKTLKPGQKLTGKHNSAKGDLVKIEYNGLTIELDAGNTDGNDDDDDDDDDDEEDDDGEPVTPATCKSTINKGQTSYKFKGGNPKKPDQVSKPTQCPFLTMTSFEEDSVNFKVMNGFKTDTPLDWLYMRYKDGESGKITCEDVKLEAGEESVIEYNAKCSKGKRWTTVELFGSHQSFPRGFQFEGAVPTMQCPKDTIPGDTHVEKIRCQVPCTCGPKKARGDDNDDDKDNKKKNNNGKDKDPEDEEEPPKCTSSLLSEDSLNIAVVVDQSFSTYKDSFKAGMQLGDLNGDGKENSIIDAEINAVLGLLDTIKATDGLDSTNVEIGLVTFDTIAYFDPATDKYVPIDDKGAVNQALVDRIKSIKPPTSYEPRGPGLTNFDDALDKAIDYFDQAEPGRTNVMIFLSDGVPTVMGDDDEEKGCQSEVLWCGKRSATMKYKSEFKKLNKHDVYRIAIGVGRSSKVGRNSALYKIDNKINKRNSRSRPIKVQSADGLLEALQRVCIEEEGGGINQKDEDEKANDAKDDEDDGDDEEEDEDAKKAINKKGCKRPCKHKNLLQCRGHVSQIRGDPHLTTSDKVKYDCQGHGEFVMIDAPKAGFKVHGRYMKVDGKPKVTTTRAVAVQHKDAPIIQVQFAEDYVDGMSADMENGCHVNVYVNGTLQDAQALDVPGAKVTLKDDELRIQYNDKGKPAVKVEVGGKLGGPYGCILNAFVCLPKSNNKYTDGTVGLFGTPDCNKCNEWMSSQPGNKRIPYPKTTLKSERRAAATAYCKKEWCIRTDEAEKKSLFKAYEKGKTHADYDLCDEGDQGTVDISKANEKIAKICCDDGELTEDCIDDDEAEACLIDGIIAGEEAAVETKAGDKKNDELDKEPEKQKSTKECKVEVIKEVEGDDDDDDDDDDAKDPDDDGKGLDEDKCYTCNKNKDPCLHPDRMGEQTFFTHCGNKKDYIQCGAQDEKCVAFECDPGFEWSQKEERCVEPKDTNDADDDKEKKKKCFMTGQKCTKGKGKNSERPCCEGYQCLNVAKKGKPEKLQCFPMFSNYNSCCMQEGEIGCSDGEGECCKGTYCHNGKCKRGKDLAGNNGLCDKGTKIDRKKKHKPECIFLNNRCAMKDKGKQGDCCDGYKCVKKNRKYARCEINKKTNRNQECCSKLGTKNCQPGECCIGGFCHVTKKGSVCKPGAEEEGIGNDGLCPDNGKSQCSDLGDVCKQPGTNGERGDCCEGSICEVVDSATGLNKCTPDPKALNQCCLAPWEWGCEPGDCCAGSYCKKGKHWSVCKPGSEDDKVQPQFNGLCEAKDPLVKEPRECVPYKNRCEKAGEKSNCCGGYTCTEKGSYAVCELDSEAQNPPEEVGCCKKMMDRGCKTGDCCEGQMCHFDKNKKKSQCRNIPINQQPDPVNNKACDDTEYLGECVGRVAGVRGDPHLTTYDGTKYDCQGHGEFVMASTTCGFKVHGRYETTPKKPWVATTKAVAIEHPAASHIQVQVADEDFEDKSAEMPNKCLINIYVDGVLQDPADVVAEGVDVDVDGREINIQYTDEDKAAVSVYVGGSPGGTYGCLTNAYICLPNSDSCYRNDVVGLLGTPDGNKRNDWMDKSGKAIAIPKKNKFEESYKYCTTNWCVRKEDDSIFKTEAYEKRNGEVTDFAFHSDCDKPFVPRKKKKVPKWVKQLCGKDTDCITDTMEGKKKDGKETKGHGKKKRETRKRPDQQKDIDDLSGDPIELDDAGTPYDSCGAVKNLGPKLSAAKGYGKKFPTLKAEINLTKPPGRDKAISVFVKDNFRSRKGKAIEGKIVVLDNFVIADGGARQLVQTKQGSGIIPPDKDDAIFVGGDMTMLCQSKSRIMTKTKQGADVRIAGKLKTPTGGGLIVKSRKKRKISEGYTKIDVQDYEEVFEEIYVKSRYWGRLVGNGAVDVPDDEKAGEKLVFKAAGKDKKNKLQVFHISQDDLDTKKGYDVIFHKSLRGKTVLINVHPDADEDDDENNDAKNPEKNEVTRSIIQKVKSVTDPWGKKGREFNTKFASSILWNFYESDKVRIQGNFIMPGTILVPDGDLIFRASGSMGRIVVGGDMVQNKPGSSLWNYEFDPPKALPLPPSLRFPKKCTNRNDDGCKFMSRGFKKRPNNSTLGKKQYNKALGVSFTAASEKEVLKVYKFGGKIGKGVIVVPKGTKKKDIVPDPNGSEIIMTMDGTHKNDAEFVLFGIDKGATIRTLGGDMKTLSTINVKASNDKTKVKVPVDGVYQVKIAFTGNGALVKFGICRDKTQTPAPIGLAAPTETVEPTRAPVDYEPVESCPDEVKILSPDKKAIPNKLEKMIKIVAKEEGQVTFQVTNLWNKLDHLYVQNYDVNRESPCFHAENVKKNMVYDFTSLCMDHSPVTVVDVWVSDKQLPEGSNAEIPKCCHGPNADNNPKIHIVFELVCSCGEQEVV